MYSFRCPHRKKTMELDSATEGTMQLALDFHSTFVDLLR
jgi:hypothetical protein